MALQILTLERENLGVTRRTNAAMTKADHLRSIDSLFFAWNTWEGCLNRGLAQKLTVRVSC
jgi:hypothetical protein